MSTKCKHRQTNVRKDKVLSQEVQQTKGLEIQRKKPLVVTKHNNFPDINEDKSIILGSNLRVRPWAYQYC